MASTVEEIELRKKINRFVDCPQCGKMDWEIINSYSENLNIGMDMEVPGIVFDIKCQNCGFFYDFAIGESYTEDWGN